MRPNSIIWFDRLFLGTMASNLASIFWMLPKIEESMRADPRFAEMGLTTPSLFQTLAITFFQILALWFFVSRVRSNIARWICVVFVGFGTIAALNQMVTNPLLDAAGMALTIINVALSVSAAAMLLTSESGDWFARRI